MMRQKAKNMAKSMVAVLRQATAKVQCYPMRCKLGWFWCSQTAKCKRRERRAKSVAEGGVTTILWRRGLRGIKFAMRRWERGGQGRGTK